MWAYYNLIQYALHVRKKRKLPNTFSEAAGLTQCYDIDFNQMNLAKFNQQIY